MAKNIETLKWEFDGMTNKPEVATLTSCDMDKCEKLSVSDINSAVKDITNLSNGVYNYLDSISYKDVDKKLTLHIVDIFCHHINSHSCLYEAIIRLYKKGKKEAGDIHVRLLRLVHDYTAMFMFIKKILNGESPDTIDLYDSYGILTTYKAVRNDNAKRFSSDLKRVVIEDNIEILKKQIKDVIKRGAPFYYEDMLEELETRNFSKRYIME